MERGEERGGGEEKDWDLEEAEDCGFMVWFCRFVRERVERYEKKKLCG